MVRIHMCRRIQLSRLKKRRRDRMQLRRSLPETAAARAALWTSGGLLQMPRALPAEPRLRQTVAGCGPAGPARRSSAGDAPPLFASKRLQAAPALRVRRVITAARGAKGSLRLGLTTDVDAITAPLAWPIVNGAMPVNPATMSFARLVQHLVYERSGWPRLAPTLLWRRKPPTARLTITPGNRRAPE